MEGNFKKAKEKENYPPLNDVGSTFQELSYMPSFYRPKLTEVRVVPEWCVHVFGMKV